MKFHLPSYLLGVASATVVIGARDVFRPVFVELAALGLQLGRTGRALFERQREHLEDLRAEVEDRVRRRTRRAHDGKEANGTTAAWPASA